MLIGKTLPRFRFEYVTPNKSYEHGRLKRMKVLGSDWENGIIRRAIVKTGDEEALRIFDDEQAELERRALEEKKNMIKEGLIKEE